MFERNAEAFYRAYANAPVRGHACCFKELPDRAYSKLKDSHEVDVSPYKDLPAEDLDQEIKRLEVMLGYSKPGLPPGKN